MSFFRSQVNVSLGIPPFFTIAGSFTPSPAEKDFAYNLLGQLATRITARPLTPLSSSRGVLTSLHDLIGQTRTLLDRHGRGAAPARRNKQTSAAQIACTVISEAIGPFTGEWHEALKTWEYQRPTNVDPGTWEQSWEHAALFRAGVENLRNFLLVYAEQLRVIAGCAALTPPPCAPILPLSDYLPTAPRAAAVDARLPLPAAAALPGRSAPGAGAALAHSAN